MDTTPNPMNVPNPLNQDNRPKPPPPPPPEITLRTLKSDVESLKQTGGSSPTPKPFTPPEIKQMPTSPSGAIPSPIRPLASPTMPPRPLTGVSSGASAGTAQSFPSRTVSPEQFSRNGSLPKPSGAPAPLIPAQKSNHKRTLTLAVSLSVIGVGAALLGYFIIFPAFFPPKTTEQTATNESPITAPSQPETVPARAAFTHQSLLAASDGAVDANLSEISAVSIAQMLAQEGQRIAAPGTFMEIIPKDSIGSIPAPLFLNALLPETAPYANALEDNFSLAFYYDENGAWPVYIFKIKSMEVAADLSSAIETSSTLGILFASAPGTPAAFKAGQIESVATRYSSYSQKGASLNIAWKGNALIISTNFNALKNNLGKIQ